MRLLSYHECTIIVLLILMSGCAADPEREKNQEMIRGLKAETQKIIGDSGLRALNEWSARRAEYINCVTDHAMQSIHDASTQSVIVERAVSECEASLLRFVASQQNYYIWTGSVLEQPVDQARMKAKMDGEVIVDAAKLNAYTELEKARKQ